MDIGKAIDRILFVDIPSPFPISEPNNPPIKSENGWILKKGVDRIILVYIKSILL